MDNKLSRNGNAVGRTIIADNSPTFSAVMPSEHPGERALANGTFVDFRVGLPVRHNIPPRVI
jgi:hypothetical protein